MNRKVFSYRKPACLNIACKEKNIPKLNDSFTCLFKECIRNIFDRVTFVFVLIMINNGLLIYCLIFVISHFTLKPETIPLCRFHIH